MSHSTFTYICRELAPHISKQCTTMREPIELERWVAVTIWRLATKVDYRRTLGELFWLGHSTVGKIVLETFEAIAQHLLHVHFPTGQTLKQVIQGFDAKSGFPQVAGAIDRTHIPSIRPQVNATDYFSRKGFPSLVMQAVVDFWGVFTDVYCVAQNLWPCTSRARLSHVCVHMWVSVNSIVCLLW